MCEKVFISHSKFDEAIGEEIEDFIRDGGYRAWRFQRDMQGGRSWREQLPKRIEEYDIFLYIATADAQNSENCQNEVQHAILKRKPLIIVTIHPSWLPSSPLDDHHAICFDGSGNAVARLMRALRSTEPLAWDKIPENWKTWDGTSKLELTNAINHDQGILPTPIGRNLTVVEKRDILHKTISEAQAYFKNELKELAHSDSRIETRIGHNSISGFTSFISIDGQLTKGCRVYISKDFNGITYDGNTHYAVEWEVDEIRRQMRDINRQIGDNLQAVIDGDANAAAFVRSLDHQHATLREQLQERETMRNQLGHMLGIQEDGNSYRTQATIAMLGGKPVLEFMTAPTATNETPNSRILTITQAVKRLSKYFVGDLGM